MSFRKKLLTTSLLLGLGCTGGTEPAPGPGVDNFGLDNAGSYAGNYAASAEAPTEAKFDQTLPETFDLIATQSPIKTQGSRGVCSVFGTVALMEHVYISEGTLTDPDFSEQFLQWSSKVEGGSFPNTGGSNANSNIRAVHRYGTVFESDWAYEPSGWGTEEDEACTGDDRPTRCYTNGEPPAAALEARRWNMPAGRWVSNRVDSIKAHMFNTNTAVQAGGTFFYQAWGHGGSRIPVYSGYRSQGYVLAPSAEDVTSSNEHRAGHSYILVGWDDNLSVQSVDGEGNLAVDADGEPVMQTGFFLFKNSWGDGWAQENPFGAGYGWIAYEYVTEHLSAYASGLPEVMVDEMCGDGRDNDGDSMIDCADSDCTGDRSCVDPAGSYANNNTVEIPDSDATGATSEIVIEEAGSISGLTVSIDIEHTYRGDLRVALEKDDRMVFLHENQGGGEDNLIETYDVGDFDGVDSAGTWTLRVVDTAGGDVGSIRGWTLDVTRCADGDCEMMPDVATYTNDSLGVIPDNDTMGVSSDITVEEGGSINAARVTVNISHEYPGDLVVTLSKNGTDVVLVANPDVASTEFMQTFTVADFNGDDAAGTWTVTVVDGAARDEGTLNSWTLEITR
ncbi:MAG: subtilisin-like proprotein convertase family protein [Polyangiales bacterium]|jgi:subtilisin-like proprotein convertase family protein